MPGLNASKPDRGLGFAMPNRDGGSGLVGQGGELSATGTVRAQVVIPHLPGDSDEEDSPPGTARRAFGAPNPYSPTTVRAPSMGYGPGAGPLVSSAPSPKLGVAPSPRMASSPRLATGSAFARPPTPTSPMPDSLVTPTEASFADFVPPLPSSPSLPSMAPTSGSVTPTAHRKRADTAPTSAQDPMAALRAPLSRSRGADGPPSAGLREPPSALASVPERSQRHATRVRGAMTRPG